MTNQSREAFEKWHAGFYGYPAANAFAHDLQDRWEIWQAALSEGRRLGLEEAAKVCEGQFDECTGRPNYHALDACEICALMFKEEKV